MACLLCFTSGLIKEKHHRPRCHKTHWSTTVARVMGKIYHRKVFSPNKTNTGEQNSMKTHGPCGGDCLQTQREETLWKIGLWKRWLLILALGLIERRWKNKKSLQLFCAVNENTVGYKTKSMMWLESHSFQSLFSQSIWIERNHRPLHLPKHITLHTSYKLYNKSFVHFLLLLKTIKQIQDNAFSLKQQTFFPETDRHVAWLIWWQSHVLNQNCVFMHAS